MIAMFRVLLVDDEPLALQHVQSLISVIPNVEVVAHTTDGSEVLHLIKETQPNLVFLDIHIGQYNGLEIAEQIELLYPTIQIVFVTAYTEHAVQAFELNAIDYLLKPVSNTRLVKTFSRLSQQQLAQQQSHQEETVQAKRKTENNYLNITTFKQGKITTQEGEILAFRTKKAEELLFLLWQNQESPLSREQIIEALWPESDPEKSATLLHSTLYQLRKTLSANGFSQPIHLQNKLYILQIPCRSDIDEFKKWMESPIQKETVEALIELYQGPYLEQNEFEWAIPRQQMIEQHWMNFVTLALSKHEELSTPMLNTLQATLSKEALFSSEWLSASLHFFGQTQQMKLLSDIFEEARVIWGEELGLDLPPDIIKTYSSYLQQ